MWVSQEIIGLVTGFWRRGQDTFYFSLLEIPGTGHSFAPKPFVHTVPLALDCIRLTFFKTDPSSHLTHITFLRSLSLINWFKSGSSSHFLLSNTYLFYFGTYHNLQIYITGAFVTSAHTKLYSPWPCLPLSTYCPSHSGLVVQSRFCQEHTSYTCLRLIGLCPLRAAEVVLKSVR